MHAPLHPVPPSLPLLLLPPPPLLSLVQ